MHGKLAMSVIRTYSMLEDRPLHNYLYKSVPRCITENFQHKI
jgi:hypothetical protein